MKETKILLSEKDLPTHFYNILPDLPKPLEPPLNPKKVFPSPSQNTEFGRKILKEDPKNTGSLGIAISEALEDAISHDNTKYSFKNVYIGSQICSQPDSCWWSEIPWNDAHHFSLMS
jgi:predicted alternative tryptophan synthase beta-subunit